MTIDTKPRDIDPAGPLPEAQAPVADVPGADPIVRQDYLPGAVLLALMTAAFLAMFFRPDGMLPWAVSRDALAEGRWQTLQLHMFAHGSILHIVMNGLALFSLAATVVYQLGSGPRAWAKFLILFEVSGLVGALTFLLIHQWSDAPMLGASGAIFGLVGFILRLGEGNGIVPLWSRAMLGIMIRLVKDHVWLFALFAILPFVLGQSGGLAWEAHLGGFVAGLVLCPLLLGERPSAPAPDGSR